MNKYMKRFQVRVFDDKDPRGEFVNEYDTLEEAQEKKKSLEEHRKEILEGDEFDYVKDHYRPLFWKIIDLAESR